MEEGGLRSLFPSSLSCFSNSLSLSCFSSPLSNEVIFYEFFFFNGVVESGKCWVEVGLEFFFFFFFLKKTSVVKGGVRAC